MGVVMVGVAIAGLGGELRDSADSARRQRRSKFRWNPFAEVIIGTRHLLRDRPLWLTVVGISYFWMLGALFQLDLFFYGSEVLHASEVRIGFMVTALAVGIGAGSLAAGKLSGDRVDLGLVPVGSALMGLCSVALAAAKGSYAWSVVGADGAGPRQRTVHRAAERVPATAQRARRTRAHDRHQQFLQHHRLDAGVGRVVAVSRPAACFARQADSVVRRGDAGGDRLRRVVLPDHLVRLVLRVAIHTLFRIRVVGRERVPRQGGALLVSNHVSFVDGILISAAIDRNVRFMIWKPYFEQPVMAIGFSPDCARFRWARTVPGTWWPRSGEGSRRAEARPRGVHFRRRARSPAPEHLQPFKRGMEKIAHGAGVPVIPTHLDRLWGSVFSFAGGKFFAKWPLRIRHPVTVSFGEPMAAGASAQEVRQSGDGTGGGRGLPAQGARRHAGRALHPVGAAELERIRDGGFERARTDAWTRAGREPAGVGLGAAEFGEQ